MTLVADLCKEHDVIVISDEVYEHLVFEGHDTYRLPACRACLSAP
ncbi:MAG: aminotransferase class I/II-fold pyridoxal phosphate-dependent enzyme [Anaerolineae bacterium]